ncbi:hypothetical protein [Rhodopila globiformis]|uniref:Hemerythrin-like domain-containing protein n=1 Tax=Rhodopila globiformis TaxID=1071 RepID=A0A2S6N3G2_RHOGL|nr:hypothetical protein [Rhodopila globiformis]PPQ29153.1 hypothetical protein CCS01_22435 [Rhodopila globiformis]
MLSKSSRMWLVAAAAAWIVPSQPIMAQQPEQHLIPQSQIIEHKETLEQLTALTHHPGEVGEAASRLLVMMKRHMAREEAFIQPPLTLLPEVAAGKVTPDMAWALPMIKRTQAEHEQIFIEHTEITDGLNELATAAEKAGDKNAQAFAESAAADSLTDFEILIPTLTLLGNALEAKLPAAH